MNDFFLVKAFVLSDKLNEAINSAIKNDLMNHECASKSYQKNFNRFLKIKSVVPVKGYSES